MSRSITKPRAPVLREATADSPPTQDEERLEDPAAVGRHPSTGPTPDPAFPASAGESSQGGRPDAPSPGRVSRDLEEPPERGKESHPFDRLADRCPGVLVTSGGTPMAALVPVTLEGRLDMAALREIDREDDEAERAPLTYDFDPREGK